jgi:O-antigen/teichoic acid export membrane protein
MALASSAVFTISVWVTAWWIPRMPRRAAGVRSMLSFGGTMALNGLVVYVAYNLDKALLGRFWGADALGIYDRAYRLINIPTTELNSAIGLVAFSALSRLQNDPIRLRSYFLKGYSLVMSMTLPSTIFCAVFADDIILVVLGPNWKDAAIIFRLLTPTILIFGIINPIAWLLYSIGLQMRSLKIALVLAPLVISAYILGLPHGPSGVAFAFSAAMTLWVLPHIVWCLHGTMISPWDLFLAAGRPFLAGIVAAALTFGAQTYFSQLEAPLLRLILGGGIMLGSYSWILLFIMGQKTFYFDLFKTLKSLPHST